MKTTLIILSFFCGVFTLLSAPSSVPDEHGWKLVWSDEFDIDGAPDPRNWHYEYTGFLRNKEEQWYTDSSDNIFVKDGMLHIVARLEKEPKPNPWYKEGSAD